MVNRPTYLKGLNSLRFFAAFFVILQHGWRSVQGLGNFPTFRPTIFYRGGSAVELFFTLSGFLITYLLLLEFEKTRSIDVRFFYFRRIIRIWPLYFLALIGGIFVERFLVPHFNGASFYFPVWQFIVFIPNYAGTHYRVGLLFPLWSIGVEEQFYLAWAPLVRVFRNYLLPLFIAGLLITLTFCFANEFILSRHVDTAMYDFLFTLKFHDMMIGACLAYVGVYHLERYQRSPLASRAGQVALLVLIAWYYLVGNWPLNDSVAAAGMSAVYGCIFLNLSLINNPLVILESQPFKYLGEISFGLYVYHMFVDYGLRFTSVHWIRHFSPAVGSCIYLAMLYVITIGVASLSYWYYESFFLRLRRAYKPGLRVSTSPPSSKLAVSTAAADDTSPGTGNS